MIFAECPVVSGVLDNKRVIGEVEILRPVSVLTFKAVLLCYKEERILSNDLRELTKSTSTLLIRKIAKEMKLVEYRCKHAGKLFTVEPKRFGKQLCIKFKVSPFFAECIRGEQKDISITAEELRQVSSKNPAGALLLLLSKRYQKRHSFQFLVEYFLGATIEQLEEVKDQDVVKVKARVDRIRETVIETARRLGVQIEYTETRIPVGRFTAKWFKTLEFKGVK